MDGSPLESKELQLVIFKIAEEEFGIEINQVKEIVRFIPITPVPRAPSFIKGVVNLRGQILVVIDLAKKLNLKALAYSEKTRIMVLEIEENTVGMTVDEVIEVVKIDKENIEGKPELIAGQIQYEYLKGVAKLGERLIILIDIGKIFSSEEVEDIRKTKG